MPLRSTKTATAVCTVQTVPIHVSDPTQCKRIDATKWERKRRGGGSVVDGEAAGAHTSCVVGVTARCTLVPIASLDVVVVSLHAMAVVVV